MKLTMLILGLIISSKLLAQNVAEFTLGIGATAVDIEGLVEKDEVSGTIASDWETLNIGISGQYYFLQRGSMTIGAELMYHYLYWYSVEVPFGNQTIYREYSVSSVRITPILRLGQSGNFKFDIGPQFNFMDGVAVGLLISPNYYIQISDNLSIPLKLRMDIVAGTVITVPLSLNAGISYKL